MNVVVAGKQPSFDWLDAESADLHCARGVGIWDWASNDEGDPDVVIGCVPATCRPWRRWRRSRSCASTCPR
ncbi:hypothetical protein [Nocardioides ungokensis]|uniref:phosphoketolase family protein n=1 Tax=Nocardioides ungokensis TaxID=1643322 RepID=UPI001FEC9C58|nr:hypothetical protein [Nocardioides ungokensis]